MVIRDTGSKIALYIKELADVATHKFAEELGKTAGKIVGTGVAGLALWGLLGDKLLVAGEAAMHWIEAIRLFM